jgi:hypothetical protein
MVHSEPVHPDHSVHPIDSRSNDAQNLRKVGQQFKTDAQSILGDAGGVSKKATQDARRLIAERAGDYALNLHGYWSRAIDSAVDSYIYSHGGDKNRLDTVLGPVSEIGGKLKSQLTAWEEATSPFSDKYDERKIDIAAHQLLTTLTGAKATLSHDGLPKEPGQFFDERMLAAVAGLMTQVGDRLTALSEGKVVTPVSLSTQAREVMEMAGKDLAAQKITDAARKAQAEWNDFQAKSTYTAESLAAALDKIGDKTTRVVEGLIDKVKKTSLEQTRIDNARTELTKVLINLQSDDGRPADQRMPPEDRTALEAQRKPAAEKLALLEMPFLSAARKGVESEAVAAKDRLDEYQQRLDDAQGAIGKNPANYWRKVKGRLLNEVKAVAGEDVKNRLDKAFDAGFADQLKSWTDALAPNNRLKPADLQRIALKISETASSYSTRATYAMQNLEPGVVQEVQDKLDAALAAIRNLAVEGLKSLFASGAFN